ncbi:hypothetical protein DL98DRAFT_587347 [Cadophora sp. DSE1049]|nr:hypothetical protein DL98DRAFT_587347 [Cadophora sp. DSE1049]
MSPPDTVEPLCKDIRRICKSGLTKEEYAWAKNSFVPSDVDRLQEMYPSVGWTAKCHAPNWMCRAIESRGHEQNANEGSLLVGVFALASDSYNTGILYSSQLDELTKLVATTNVAYVNHLSEGDPSFGTGFAIGYMRICFFVVRYLVKALNLIRGGPLARELRQSAWNSTRELQRTIGSMARTLSDAECQVWNLAQPSTTMESSAIESAPAPQNRAH